jgi:hypothetical protein
MSYPGDQQGQQPAYPSYPDHNQGGFQPPQQQPNPYGQPPQQSNPFGQPQPQSAPPAGQPYSAPPAGQPYSSPPAPAGYGPEQTAPYSGAGYGYDPNAAGVPPTSGAYGGGLPPTSGPGQFGGPSAPTGQPKNKLVPIFASLMVVFLLATAVVSVLYITKNGDYNDTVKAAQTKETQLSSDLKKSQDDLKKAQEDLASTKRDLGGSQAQADELARQKAVISKCFKLLIEASQAISAGNQALADQKRAEYTPVCNEADKYLD